MRRLVTLRWPVAALVAACSALPGAAHEVRPAYLRLDAQQEAVDAAERYAVVWKRPLTGGRPLPLLPVFPRSCSQAATAVDTVTRDALVQHSELACPDGLRSGEVSVEGLATTITDVVLHIAFADGTRAHTVLTPEHPSLRLGAAGDSAAAGYFQLGVAHLLFGIDHILFVLSLLFFLQRLVPLAKAVTAFTAAHSITLGLSALDVVRLPQAPVEAVIALSIMFLAVEKLRGGPDTITARHTWVVAFAFGLLHGFGFAGALADIGLPKENLLLALLLFNLGVEFGQLGVVFAGLAVAWSVRRLGLPVPGWLVLAPLWASGSLGAYWFVSRTAAVVS